MPTKIRALQDSMKHETLVGRLCIQGSRWGFHIDKLDALNERRWFGEDVLLLGMRLTKQLSYMRIGDSVDMESGLFKHIAKHVKKWTAGAKGESLVCLFPLYLQSNHFTLLKINQMDKTIYHYDTAKMTLLRSK